MVAPAGDVTVQCPHCGGVIQAAARLCKHCRRSVEPRLPHTTRAVGSRSKVVIAVVLALVVVIALVAGLRSGEKENAGLWSGTCPATESELMKEVATCFEAERGKSLVAAKNCGRTAVAERTGGNDHYKLGDTLNDCYLCGQFILGGLYPAKKGASECVSSRWMESDEFKKLQNVLSPGSR